ncbi:hypothetical protein CTI14_72275, partial [Methylobacterium radiotolerans]
LRRFTGKLFAEALEEADRGSNRGPAGRGRGRMSTLLRRFTGKLFAEALEEADRGSNRGPAGRGRGRMS